MTQWNRGETAGWWTGLPCNVTTRPRRKHRTFFWEACHRFSALLGDDALARLLFFAKYLSLSHVEIFTRLVKHLRLSLWKFSPT